MLQSKEPKLLGEVIRDLIQQGEILSNQRYKNYGSTKISSK
jgi:hypothetical protein